MPDGMLRWTRRTIRQWLLMPRVRTALQCLRSLPWLTHPKGHTHDVRDNIPVGPLCSAGITPRPRSYGPLSRGKPVIGTYLTPLHGQWDEEGFSSCLMCPGHRAVALTPPECPTASASCGRSCSLRAMSVARPPEFGVVEVRWRSLALRPDDSLTIPIDGFVDGRRWLGFPRRRHPSYRALALTLMGLSPTEHISFVGHTLIPVICS